MRKREPTPANRWCCSRLKSMRSRLFHVLRIPLLTVARAAAQARHYSLRFSFENDTTARVDLKTEGMIVDGLKFSYLFFVNAPEH
jgi:hypothetical protein